MDGSDQRQCIKPNESVGSPTIALESLFVTLLIEAYKGRDVTTYNVPGAYFKCSPEDTLIRLLDSLSRVEFSPENTFSNNMVLKSEYYY